VCTKRGADDKGTLGENGMFFRLFDYISGQNEDSKFVVIVVVGVVVVDAIVNINVVAVNVLQTLPLLLLHQRTERR
jgi:hypothetical protein